ncbi:MAG: hypothetical protein JO131_07810 [Gammaproteobacteria bacterium]|nr:hypothetical protein [Gammaproteobacteria bacterium]
MQRGSQISLFQTPWLTSFTFALHCNEQSSYKKQFCETSIYFLKKYFADNQLAKSIIEKFNLCQSNQELYNIIQSLPVLAKNSAGKPSAQLIHFLKYISSVYKNRWKEVKQNLSSTTFSYNELTQIPERKSVHTTEFKATMMPNCDFIKFSIVDSKKPKLNNTKLRLSINEKQFTKAWELIKEHFLSVACPITAFKIINLSHSYKEIEKFTQAVFSSDLSITNEKIKNQLNDYKRLVCGGQITLYLPINMNEATYKHIADFLHNIIKILLENKINSGKHPLYDRTLNNYISGRVEKNEFEEYILPRDASIKNALDPVLNNFEKLFSFDNEKKCAFN